MVYLKTLQPSLSLILFYCQSLKKQKNKNYQYFLLNLRQVGYDRFFKRISKYIILGNYCTKTLREWHKYTFRQFIRRETSIRCHSLLYLAWMVVFEMYTTIFSELFFHRSLNFIHDLSYKRSSLFVNAHSKSLSVFLSLYAQFNVTSTRSMPPLRPQRCIFHI